MTRWSYYGVGVAGPGQAGGTPERRAVEGDNAEDPGGEVSGGAPEVPGDDPEVTGDNPEAPGDAGPRAAEGNDSDTPTDGTGSAGAGDGVEVLGAPLGEEDRLRRSFQAPALRNLCFLRTGSSSNSR